MSRRRYPDRGVPWQASPDRRISLPLTYQGDAEFGPEQLFYRELRACDYGAPTIRKRFLMVMRCDGCKIHWPEATHGDPKSLEVQSGKLAPWRTAAECIDWNIPARSIFDRKSRWRKIRSNVSRAASSALLSKAHHLSSLSVTTPRRKEVMTVSAGNRC